MRGKLTRRRLIQAGVTLLAVLGLPPGVRASGERTPSVEAAFAATDAAAAMQHLFGGAVVTPSDAVRLSLPLRADNGANVPITVATTLSRVRSIAIVVEKNPRPLAVWFELSAATRPAIGCRIKLAETTLVRAVAETDDGLFGAVADVTVTIGGCA